MALGESHTHVEATCSLLYRAQILPKSGLRAEHGGSCSFAQKGLWTRAQECAKQTREERNGAFISSISWGSAQTRMTMIRCQELHCDFQVIILVTATDSRR